MTPEGLQQLQHNSFYKHIRLLCSYIHLTGLNNKIIVVSISIKLVFYWNGEIFMGECCWLWQVSKHTPHLCMYIYVYVYVCECLSVSMYVRGCLYIYIYIYIYMSLYIYTHTHTHTHIYIYMYIYIPNTPLGQDMTQGQSLGGVWQIWIHSFPSPRLVASPRLKKLLCLTIFP